MRIQHWAIAIAVLAAFTATSAATLARGQGWGDDFALYLMQAESLLNGHVDSFLSANVYANANSTDAVGPIAGPWGYPLLIVPVLAAVGVNPLALNALNVPFLLAFLIVFLLLVKDRLDPMESVLLVAVLASCPAYVAAENNILTDIPFLAFSTVSLLLIDRLLSSGAEEKTTHRGLAVGTGGVIYLAFFVRGVGGLLLVTLLAGQLIVAIRGLKVAARRRGQLADRLMPYAVFGILWCVTAVAIPAGQEYGRYTTAHLTEAVNLSLLGHNAQYYFHVVATAFLAGLPSEKIVYGFLLAFMMVGVVARVRKDYVFLIYSAITMATLLIIPLGGLRYLFPVLPFFLYFSYQGIRTAFLGVAEGDPRLGKVIGYLVFLGLLASFGGTTARAAISNLVAGRQMEGPFDAESSRMFAFIRNETPEQSTVIFRKPRAMRLFTGRNAIRITNCAQLDQGDYLVFHRDREDGQLSLSDMEACGIDLAGIFENRNFTIYRLGRP